MTTNDGRPEWTPEPGERSSARSQGSPDQGGAAPGTGEQQYPGYPQAPGQPYGAGDPQMPAQPGQWAAPQGPGLDYPGPQPGGQWDPTQPGAVPGFQAPPGPGYQAPQGSAEWQPVPPAAGDWQGAPNQWGGPPPAPKNNKVKWIAGGIIAVVVIAAGGVGAYFAFSGDSSSSSAEGKVRASVDDYAAAFNAQDVDGINKLRCSKVGKYTKTRLASAVKHDGKVTIEVKDVDIDGDSGVVTTDIHYSKSGNTEHSKLKVVLEDGQWKACGDAE